MAERQVHPAAVVAACMSLVAPAIVMTIQKAALTADGSYFLVRVLTDESVFGPPGRLFANALRQAPVLAAVWTGETDTAWLSVVHGAGQLVLPALVWSLAIVLARADRVAFVAVATLAGLCAGSTWLFSVSENVLAVPVLVLLAVLLWLPRWRRGHAALAVAASLLLVSSYETAVLTGLAIGVWAISRGRSREPRLERVACVAVAAAAATSVVVAAVGASGAGPGPRHAQAYLYYLVSLEPWPFYIALAGVVALVAAVETALPPAAARAVTVSALALLTIGVVATELTIAAAYEARGGTSAASLALLLYLWWRWARRDRERTRREAPSWMPLVPIGALLVTAALLGGASRAWERDLSMFREAVTTNAGVVTAEETVPANRADVLWDWTALYLSLVVRSHPDDALLVNRSPSYVPFTPREARERFGDDYTWGRR